MKTRRNNHLLQTTAWLIASLMVCFACTDDELITATNSTADNDVPAGYYFVLADSNTPGTRVSYTDTQHSDFEDGDMLGIYAIDEAGNRVTTANGENVPPNACYRVVTVKNINGSMRQVLENVNEDMPTGLRYVLYYPYDSNMTFERLSNLTFTIRYNQNAANVDNYNGLRHEVTAYEASDLLWDVAQAADGQNYVNIEMEHAMANIILNISEEYLQPSGEDVYNVFVTNCQTRASGIDLRTTWADNESFPDNNITNWSWKYTTSRNEGITYQQVRMWNTGLTSSGMLCFRAAIPACQTIPAGTALFSIAWTENGVNSPKTFSSKEALTLKPGKNYIFTVMKQTDPDQPVIPDVTDDDSWVLDVLDPETGEPVGLLCREYLRYQPQINDVTTVEQVTGTEVLDGKKAISSQAWVFYQLQPDGKTPELSKGTVLRFIYDIYINSNAAVNTNVPLPAHFWPLPHTQSEGNTHQGFFTPEHGFKWIKCKTPIAVETVGGGYYGLSSSEVDPVLLEDSEKETNYYMHGGTITWDSSNKISDFTPLENSYITNAIAKANGHIAIDPQSKKVSVSYATVSEKESYKDSNGNKVGILIPRNLADTRLNDKGEVETVIYPLVKIGYNQFWISKPFKAKTFNDGTSITCYNKKGDPNGATIEERKPATVTFQWGDLLSAGYIYNFAQNVTTGTGNSNTNYDPYNDPIEMAGPQDTEWDNRPSNFQPAPLYNKLAVEDNSFLPIVQEEQCEYIMPTYKDIESIQSYFGYGFATKLTTREIARSLGNQTWAYGDNQYIALMRGETFENSADCFTANISGFNLHAMGHYTEGSTKGETLGKYATLILRTESTVEANSVSYLSFAPYNAWETTSIILEDGTLNWGNYYTNYFAQVRIFMRFKKPTAGNSILSTRSTTVDKERTRNIYVPLISK